MHFTIVGATEGTSIQQRLDEFNQIFIDLKTIDIKLNDEDQDLICSSPPANDNFVNTKLCSRECISMEDVKVSLNSRE